MRRWLAVACAAHVRIGRGEGFMQVCHGKAGPLRRISPGDGVVYYSAAETFRGAAGLKSFTGIGRVKPGEPYQVEQFPGFRPFRRDVDFWASDETPIKPLLQALDFTAKGNWGYQLRFGLIEISAADFEVIAAAMCAREADAA